MLAEIAGAKIVLWSCGGPSILASDPNAVRQYIRETNLLQSAPHRSVNRSQRLSRKHAKGRGDAGSGLLAAAGRRWK